MKLDFLKLKMFSFVHYLKTFVKWFLIALAVGFVGGIIGCAFHLCVDFVTEIRGENSWLIYLLPFGGLLIVAIYGLCKVDVNLGTNRIIESVRTDEKVPTVMAPLIFVSTVITHLLGGSAGREGAALQLGGSIGYRLGRIFRLNEKDMHIVIMAGMSGVFAALFGTPLTATFFALEVISVGIMYYVALIPCIISSLVAYGIAGLFGIAPVGYNTVAFQPNSIKVIVASVILALLCALVGILFCTSIKKCEIYAHKYIKNNYIRALVGGVVIVILTLIVRSYDYNGAGMDVISDAMTGHARPEAFLLKIIFTSITIAAGFKGGEIVPTFFIGSTFGCVAGSLLGLNPGFGAAIGFVALFCSVTNCPVASIALAIEVFGGNSILIFALVCAVSYMMSGYYGLYKSQKIVYSKLDAKYININAK